MHKKFKCQLIFIAFVVHMVYECEGGTPRKFVVKKPLKTGDIVRAGQYYRIELGFSMSDETVKSLCDSAAQSLCQPSEEAHLTYYHITNTFIITEAQALKDLTVPAEFVCYLLQPIWEAYKIPIIIGLVAFGGFAVGFAAKR
jgi:hypothetical protein